MTTSSTPIAYSQIVDVRGIECAIKHPLLVKTFMEMPPGRHFILINDREPIRLRDQFAAQWPDTFTWERLADETDAAQVKITKLKPLGTPARPIATTCGGH